MGSDVKVFDIGYQGDGWCNDDPEGEWVRHSDYRALEAERDVLRGALLRVRDWAYGSDNAGMKIVHGIAHQALTEGGE